MSRAGTVLDFGVFGGPETYVVDERGVIVAKLVGAVGPGRLDTVLTRSESGTPVYEQNDRYRHGP